MRNPEALDAAAGLAAKERNKVDRPLHPMWLAFIRYCAELEHGQIETLKIEDGLPALAETVRQKVRFAKK